MSALTAYRAWARDTGLPMQPPRHLWSIASLALRLADDGHEDPVSFLEQIKVGGGAEWGNYWIERQA